MKGFLNSVYQRGGDCIIMNDVNEFLCSIASYLR